MSAASPTTATDLTAPGARWVVIATDDRGYTFIEASFWDEEDARLYARSVARRKPWNTHTVISDGKA